MELRHLKYFLVLAEELNFSRAAVRLHISQPPLSRQIQQLEDELGAQLFQRTGKGVELTQAGHSLVAEAANILSLVGQAKERARMAGDGHVGRIDVGIFGSAILDVIPRALQVMRIAHNLERIADLATNIAEEVIYIVEGRDIKHHHVEDEPANP